MRWFTLMFLSMAQTSLNNPQRTNANHNKTANLFSIAVSERRRVIGLECASKQSMNWYNRLSQYHSESRPSFILFTEFIAFVGAMAAMIGLAFLREVLL